MNITPKKINRFMLFKLPLAYLGGVRVASIEKETAIVNIRHKWLNQNPFKSMFWAAQGMAAEMATGVLVMRGIENIGKKVSMLVINQRGNFTKKATGKIRFECHHGGLVANALEESNKTGEGRVITMKAEGFNTEGVSVCNFHFEWSLKVKQ
ncbi:DUF4442 domain-containing protein [Flavobacteriaceae bacterium]|jgi:hypothetical protein|nr:DUF4442 domain-containing protein [Flavobacteriaceae bacterium]MDB4192005.1 DUF4442 domain-containing protein [Flavobacteriaceae bacterium]MDB4228280.1 DUF4442 domain-containing protein [Flavobacteriaceae bacterium]MDB4237326.1 DUF4442 domain-containing protein [Flavobacteriaceae bacterium]MDB9780405.1 DUF4442 domain-containing protein [Flavobacteriaceae bacterium]|tara:strand:+ start:68 stop:523 length:456 start_codon:yes stop_codon:yes gene_type:complete